MGFKKLFDVGQTYLKRFNSDHIFHLSNLATASDQVSKIKSKLERAKSYKEKRQLEEELEKARVAFNHYKDLVDRGRESVDQDNDRIRRIMGTDTERSKHLFRNKEETNCILKNKGDQFELEVGRLFERKGCFVFYNGMLRSEVDQGVDLVIYDSDEKVVWYAQCKNWNKKVLNRDDLTTILKKLSRQRITPTRVEIERQKKMGWSNGSYFDDRVNYDVRYCLVVPRYDSISPEAQKEFLGGFVRIPQQSGKNIVMETFLCNNGSLNHWIHFD